MLVYERLSPRFQKRNAVVPVPSCLHLYLVYLASGHQFERGLVASGAHVASGFGPQPVSGFFVKEDRIAFWLAITAAGMLFLT